MNEALGKTMEKVTLQTAALLADCIDKLGDDSNLAQTEITAAKIAACVGILKLITENFVE